ADVLRASGRAPSVVGAAGLRNAVIVAEVALSFVLLTGSGLMIRSFVELTRIDPGFEPKGVLTFGIGNVRARTPEERAAFLQTTLSGDEKETLFFPQAATGGVGAWAVRTSGDANRVAGPVRATIQGINKRYLVNAIRPLTDLVDTARAPTRFALVLMAVFAAI